jgi:hypothetical protein
MGNEVFLPVRCFTRWTRESFALNPLPAGLAP